MGEISLATSVVSGCAGPSAADTRITLPRGVGEITMVPSSAHQLPRGFGASARVTTAPPVTGTFFTVRRTPPVSGDAIQVSVPAPEIADVYLGEVALPVAISPDGRHLAVYGADAHGTNHLWLHDLRTGATRLLAENAFAAAWSTDSEAIAYFAEGKLKTAAVEGGPARTVCDARPEGTPAWHADTILFAQYSREPGIYRVAAGGGTPERIVGPAIPDPESRVFAWWPQFLPDGNRFLYLGLHQPQVPGQEITHELLVGSLDGAAPQPVAPINSRAVFVDGHLLFVREGTLLAQPFDPDALRFTGEATRFSTICTTSATPASRPSASRRMDCWHGVRRGRRRVWRGSTAAESRWGPSGPCGSVRPGGCRGTASGTLWGSSIRSTGPRTSGSTI